MNIDLLAKMVKEAVMDQDNVTLPGVGSFVAELVPAAFADRGYTILPPYRRLYFSPRQGEDNLLAVLYAKANNISEADASRILTDFLSEMKEILIQKKTIVFPGLGRLRATRENHFFFVADEDLDIYPAGFGLQPISLKTHEETQEEVAEAVATLAQILEPEPAVEPVAEPAAESVAEPAAEPVAEPAEEPVEEPGAELVEAPTAAPAEEPEAVPAEEKALQPEEPRSAPEAPAPVRKKSPWKAVWITLLALLGLILLAAIGLAVVGRVAPQWLDTFLYTPEELEILRP